MKYLGTPVKLTHHNQPAPGPMAGGCFSWASPWGITEWPPYPEGKGNPGWGQDRMQTRCPGALSNPKMYCWWFTLYFISLCQHLEEFSLKVWISSFLYKKKKIEGFLTGSVHEESTRNTQEMRRHKRCGFDPWARGRCPVKVNGHPLLYSCLENPMDK